MPEQKQTKVHIKVDTNDADYLEQVVDIGSKEAHVLSVFCEAIRKFKPYKVQVDGIGEITHHHNFPYGECHRPDMGEKSVEELYPRFLKGIEIMKRILPYSEYGIHTIVSIDLVDKKEKLL